MIHYKEALEIKCNYRVWFEIVDVTKYNINTLNELYKKKINNS